MGRQHPGMDRLGVRQVPEGSGEQGTMEKILKNFLKEKSHEIWPAGRKKKKPERVTDLGKRTKRGDSRVESNDSPEIPERGETSDIPGLPSGVLRSTHSKYLLNATLFQFKFTHVLRRNCSK